MKSSNKDMDAAKTGHVESSHSGDIVDILNGQLDKASVAIKEETIAKNNCDLKSCANDEMKFADKDMAAETVEERRLA